MIKTIDNIDFWLEKSWDLKHGYGWFCQVYNLYNHKIGFGFHKTNKFTCVKLALKDLKNEN